jgi:hypothetical protein
VGTLHIELDLGEALVEEAHSGWIRERMWISLGILVAELYTGRRFLRRR